MNILLLLSLFFFSFLTYIFTGKWITRSRLKSKKLTRISELIPGSKFKIAGKIISLEPPLLSPIQGHECVWFKLVIKYHTGDRYVSKGEVDERRMQDFLVKNGKDKVFIKAENIEVAMKKTEFKAKVLTKDQKARLEKFVNSLDTSVIDQLRHKPILGYYEAWLPPEKEIYVMGEVYDKEIFPQDIKLGIRSDMIRPIYISEFKEN